MKALYLLLFPIIFINNWAIAQQNPVQSQNTITDTRDGQKYNTITINNDLGMGVNKSQTWLAENLRFDTQDKQSWYHESLKTESDKQKYGRLYTWEAAKKACPRGWHLSTDIEWQILMHQLAKGGLTYNDGDKKAYQQLLEGGNSGFAALLGGGRDSDGEFGGLSEYGYYWSATERDAVNAWYYDFRSGSGKVSRDNGVKANGLSCRCLKDN